MRRSAKPQHWKTEAEMCAAFIAAATGPKLGRGRTAPEWVAYAETQGWDILLVRRSDGLQIGIEAKLRFGLDVVNQAIEQRSGYWHQTGPDFRAVLVPQFAANGLSDICAYVGITIVTMRPPYGPGSYGPAFDPYLPGDYEHPSGADWYELCPIERYKLPEYVPDVPAGASGPVQLTDWKIRAIKIAIILEQRGFVTRGDFKAIGIDHRRWLAQAWVRPSEGVWIAGGMPDFKAQHPVVYHQIAADAPKWMTPGTPRSTTPAAVQGALL